MTSSAPPSVDSHSYPAAPPSHRANALPPGTIANGSGVRSGPGGNGNDPIPGSADPGAKRPESGDPAGAPQGHVEVGPKVINLPKDIPLPEFLQRREFHRFEMKVQIAVDVQGHAQVKLFQSCGQPDLDKIVVDQLQAAPWKPATRDGQPIESSMTMTLTGDLKLGTSTFSILGVDQAPPTGG